MSAFSAFYPVDFPCYLSNVVVFCLPALSPGYERHHNDSKAYEFLSFLQKVSPLTRLSYLTH